MEHLWYTPAKVWLYAKLTRPCGRTRGLVACGVPLRFLTCVGSVFATRLRPFAFATKSGIG